MQLAPQPEAAQLSLDLDEVRGPDALYPRAPVPHRHRPQAHAPGRGRARAGARRGVVSAVRFGVQPGGTLRVVIETNTTLAAHWANARGRTLLLNLGAWSSAPVSADTAAGACRARPR